MDTEKLGRFIAELRKEKNMTQKTLAERLNVTDKAVSKWERGLSCPDISLLSPLSELLGISVGELLNAKREPAPYTDTAVDSAVTCAEETVKQRTATFRRIFSLIFSAAALLSIAVCLICDFALSGTISWSLYPLCSVAFAWAITFPAMIMNKNGIMTSLTVLTILIVPFLAAISKIVGDCDLIIRIGVPVSAVSMALLWAIYVLFRTLNRKKLLAAGFAMIVTTIACLLINIIVANILSEPVIDVWDIISLMIMVVVAVIFFITHSIRK